MGKMKKERKSLSILLLLSVLLLIGLFGCGKKDTRADDAAEQDSEPDNRVYISKVGFSELSEEQQAKKGRYASAEAKLADMQVVAEDEKLVLYLDPEFAEFAVVDKANGESWFSNPYNFENDAKAGSDSKKNLQALISLTYYDKTDKEGTMNSYSDCTSKNQYTVERLDNGFAFHMQIGRAEEVMLVPSVVEVSKFEEKILPLVSDRDARRLNSYYTRVSMSDSKLSQSVKDGYLKNYPGLNEHDFYILRGVVDREKRMLEDIIRQTEYTVEDMEEDLANSGYVEEEAVAALFKMSMYVELDHGDLKITVPAGMVSYDETEFHLAKFRLLNYFGAGTYDQDGYLFIPDGSGALIQYNKYGLKKILYTTNSVYGTDYSLSFQGELNSLSSQSYFPVGGNKEGGKAFLMIVEDGESLANIISESGNILSSYETVFSEFHYKTSFTVNYTDSTKIKGLYTYHDTNIYDGDYVVRYRFLEGEDADYVGMAKSYQDYLVGRGMLAKLPASESGSNFYLEALGAIEKTSTFLGIPYVESVGMTTFSQAQDILKELLDAGASGLKLRYKGWMNGGMYYTVSNKVDIEKSLGGKKGLEALEAFAQANGIGLYPDADFFLVRADKNFDGYSASSNAARSIRREKLYLEEPQAFTTLPYLQYLSYSVSPYYYSSYMKDFFREYDKLSVKGISMGTMGNMLYSEFHKKRAVNREQVKDIIVGSLEQYAADKKLMVNGGNAYMLAYVEDIVNMPVYHSGFTMEDESIPFLQLVLHGYKHYAGEAMNLSGSYEEQFLKSIEYGSAPFFTIAAENTSILKETMFCYYYSVQWDALKGEIMEYARKWKEAYDGLESLSMIGHEKLADGVYRTEYENGTVFYVNYGENEVTLPDGSSLAARDYKKAGSQSGRD